MESRVYLCVEMNIGSGSINLQRIRFQTMQLSIQTTKPPNVHENYQRKGELIPTLMLKKGTI
jgi:hypothetical protein